MIRYFITFSYDGSCFSGFQRQKNLKTVQGTIENAIKNLGVGDVSINASGRTDKGVHALMQCAHFDLEKDLKDYNLKKYLNSFFDGEIYITEVKKVDLNFHARYDVKGKTYSYYINMGEFSPVSRNYVYQYCKPLDIDLMKKSASCLIGEHDFRSFCTDEKEKVNCVRNIYKINFELNGEVLKITFEGNGFLRKMIRNIIAVLISIGSLEKDVSYMEEVLNMKSREGNLKCAPPEGLYLEKVCY